VIELRKTQPHKAFKSYELGFIQIDSHKFTSPEDLQQPLMRYVALYNHQLPQSTPKSNTRFKQSKTGTPPIPTCF
jgi:hypothetical protein